MNMREEFEKWFTGVESGDDVNWKEPDYASDEWNDYIARRQLAKGAWEEAWQAAQPKWIKCSEPPEEECSVLLLDSNQVVWTGIYFPDDGGFQLDLGDDRDVTFTHYMLTPNPPEE
ncbi:hypothetical protein I6G97_10005 [Edwardsiella hoshinae]|uniref:DUF551 domain-containing protein n=1 Tax=Edwardsiella hoshinae TaxID=93378 RepID=A0A376DGK9_9GAMM|nr:phage protein [Edwardsiella hoshinae]QPR26811.1 hypothetical protein I6G97_10005 [Edwardsiella hoshinae]STC89332.1 Uncharacterised protein [Edwardsiella hoshinae]